MLWEMWEKVKLWGSFKNRGGAKNSWGLLQRGVTLLIQNLGEFQNSQDSEWFSWNHSQN